MKFSILASILQTFDSIKNVDNIPSDVKKLLAYDIATDISTDNKIITDRLLEMLTEYNVDIDTVEKAFKKLNIDDMKIDIDDEEDEVFELSEDASRIVESLMNFVPTSFYEIVNA